MFVLVHGAGCVRTDVPPAVGGLRTRSPERRSTSPRARVPYVTGTNLVVDGGIAAGRHAAT